MMSKAPSSFLIRVVALPLWMRLKKAHLGTEHVLFQIDEFQGQRFDRCIGGRYPIGLVLHQECQSDFEPFLRLRSYGLRGH